MTRPRLPVAIPAVAIAALLPWVLYCARSYPAHALYFDHSMYQYTGWCVRHGISLYGEVAVPDGPFITWLHAVVQIVAGESDRAFRIADLVIQTLGAFAVGFVLAPRRRRALWASAIATLWLAQYFRYDWHWTAQREAYYALAGYLGMAMLVIATRARSPGAVLALAVRAAVGSQLSASTGVIFVVLAACRRSRLSPPLRRRLLHVWRRGLALILALVALALTAASRAGCSVLQGARAVPLHHGSAIRSRCSRHRSPHLVARDPRATRRARGDHPGSCRARTSGSSSPPCCS